jgi:hypothetical protein
MFFKRTSLNAKSDLEQINHLNKSFQNKKNIIFWKYFYCLFLKILKNISFKVEAERWHCFFFLLSTEEVLETSLPWGLSFKTFLRLYTIPCCYKRVFVSVTQFSLVEYILDEGGSDSDKHSSLPKCGINNDWKKFYDTLSPTANPP